LVGQPCGRHPQRSHYLRRRDHVPKQFARHGSANAFVYVTGTDGTVSAPPAGSIAVVPVPFGPADDAVTVAKSMAKAIKPGQW